MRIGEDEFTARRESFAARLEEAGLAGAVRFDPHYVHYYSGFFFVPTERPVALALAVGGRGGMLVPRLGPEPADANTAADEVAHCAEHPGDRPPMEALRGLLGSLGVAGALGADTDGYP